MGEFVRNASSDQVQRATPTSDSGVEANTDYTAEPIAFPSPDSLADLSHSIDTGISTEQLHIAQGTERLKTGVDVATQTDKDATIAKLKAALLADDDVRRVLCEKLPPQVIVDLLP